MNEQIASDQDICMTDKIWACVGYLWILCFIPLLFKKGNPFVTFHVRQGLMLFVLWLFCLVVSAIPILGHLLGFIGNVFILIMIILGIIHAINGEYWAIPVFGKTAAGLKI
ncbi:hypothetical protein ACFL6Y_07500 [Elusimicrobiota bacterium]